MNSLILFFLMIKKKWKIIMGSLYLNSKLLYGWNEILYKIYFILVLEYFLWWIFKIYVYWGSVGI